jgi:four helix bundle protein
VHIAHVQPFRNLNVWQRAHAHIIAVRRAIRSFPRDYSALRSQIIKSVESVPFNIVEGCGSDSNREFGRYLGVSIKSSMELEGQLEAARDYGILSFAIWQRLARETVEIRKMLWGLRNRVLEDPDRKKRPPRRQLRRRSPKADGIDEPTDQTEKTDETAD